MHFVKTGKLAKFLLIWALGVILLFTTVGVVGPLLSEPQVRSNGPVIWHIDLECPNAFYRGQEATVIAIVEDMAGHDPETTADFGTIDYHDGTYNPPGLLCKAQYSPNSQGQYPEFACTFMVPTDTLRELEIYSFAAVPEAVTQYAGWCEAPVYDSIVSGRLIEYWWITALIVPGLVAYISAYGLKLLSPRVDTTIR